MPQKKKGKKTNKKTHIKKHLTQKQNIIFQSIPNYSSGQFTGHQNNKIIFNMLQLCSKKHERII